MGRAWLATIAANADVELVGLVDLNTDVAAAGGRRRGRASATCRSAASVADLLAGGVGDRRGDQRDRARAPTTRSTPPRSPPGCRCCARSRWPSRCAECLSMVAAAELSGQLLMVSQSRRYWRAVTHVARASSPSSARSASASCQFFKAPHFGGFREQMAYPLLVDMAIHQFDLARHLIGAEPTSVFCRVLQPGLELVRRRRRRLGDLRVRRRRDASPSTAAGARPGWRPPGTATGGSGRHEGTASWDGDHAPVAETGDGQPLADALPDEPEQIAGSLTEFVARCCAERGVPNGEVHSNVLSVAMVEAAVRSAETGQRVALADGGRGRVRPGARRRAGSRPSGRCWQDGRRCRRRWACRRRDEKVSGRRRCRPEQEGSDEQRAAGRDGRVRLHGGGPLPGVAQCAAVLRPAGRCRADGGRRPQRRGGPGRSRPDGVRVDLHGLA